MNRYQKHHKSVPNWYLSSFGSENSVLVLSTICLSLTMGFIQKKKKSLPYNFFGLFSFGGRLKYLPSSISFTKRMHILL
ncbi:hypothetical protein Hanom_Chr04g00345721 [Helianthus anomalus]